MGTGESGQMRNRGCTCRMYARCRRADPRHDREPKGRVEMVRTNARVYWLVSLLCGAICAKAQDTPTRLAQMPDIHGDQVVFSAEGDLWLCSVDGGSAVRITTHEGEERSEEHTSELQSPC